MPVEDGPEIVKDPQQSGEVADPALAEVVDEAGEAALGRTVAKVDVPFDRAEALNKQRTINEQGWQAVADEANSQLSWSHKRKHGKVTKEDVMQDEARKADQIAKDVLTGADGRKDNEYKGYQEAVDGLANEAASGEGPYRPFRSFNREEIPIFEPIQTKNDVENAGREFANRERDIKPIAKKAAEALSKGDVADATKIIDLAQEVHFIDYDAGYLSIREEIEPALRTALADIYKSGDAKKLELLLDSPLLSSAIYEGITNDLELDDNQREKAGFWLGRVVKSRAIDAVKEYVTEHSEDPKTEEAYRRGWLDPAQEFQIKMTKLMRTGIVTKEEMREDGDFTSSIAEILSAQMVQGFSRNGPEHGGAVKWNIFAMEKMGILDPKKLLENPSMLAAASLLIGPKALEQSRKRLGQMLEKPKAQAA